MLSLLQKLFGCWHKWSAWSKPYKAKSHMDGFLSQSDHFMYTVWCQERHCEKCNTWKIRRVG